MKPLLLFVLLSTAAWGQDSTMKAELPDSNTVGLYKAQSFEKSQISGPLYIEHVLYDENGNKIAYRKNDSLPVIPDWKKFFDILDSRPELRPQVDTTIGKFDLTPVTLLVRIQGRPWAFFHDGWEVRKVDSVSYMEPYWCSTEGCLVAHPDVEKYRKEVSHLLYLDSRKRPIRKEWVIYQTFKR